MNDETSRDDRLSHLRDVTAGYGDHEDVAALYSELESGKPNHGIVSQLLERLRVDPHLQDAVSVWANDPRTQAFLAELNAMGL